MADNIVLNAGAGGATLAADDITSVWYQRVKLTDGTADSTTPINVGNGVSANALRVTLSSDGTGVVKIWDGTDTALVTAGGALNVIANANSGVDIGDVDVLSVIPGTGATNLGKAIGDVAGATDTGVVMLGVLAHTDSLAHSANADGDYDRLSLTEYREVRTRDQRTIVLDRMDATTGWTVLNDDAANIATSTNHVYGTNSLTFDKVNGTANTVYAIIQKTLSSVTIHDIIAEGGFVGVSCYLPSLTNVVNVVVRLGTSSAAYQEWTWPVADLTAARWMPLRANIMQPSTVQGNGWTTEDLDWMAVGVQMSAEANTLSGIIFDRFVLIGGRVSDGTLNATVTSSVSTPNINMQRIGSGGGTVVSVSSGATDAGTQRIIAATNSPDVTALEIMDDWDESNRAAVNTIAGQVGVQGGSGTVSALTQRVVLATDVALPAGTNAIGKLAANDGVDIGDVGIQAGTAYMGKVLPMDRDITLHTAYAKKYYTNAGAVTDGIIWSPAGGTRWHVMSLFIQVSAAATVTLEDDKAGGDEAIWKAELAANSGVFQVFPDGYPLASGEDAADLLVTTSAGNVYITVTGYEI